MTDKAFGLTDIGRRREDNQDNLHIDEDAGVFAVADGMGGHAAGEVASRLAIEALAEVIADGSSGPRCKGPEDAAAKLREAFELGNRKICESVAEHEDWRGMGTTIVALALVGDRAVIGHVGDSRAYLLRGERLKRLTEDHSWVSQQVQKGLMTDEEADRHPMRNIVTRALGQRSDLEIELTEEEVLPGDLFVLCSDGLNSMLSDEEILRTTAPLRADPESACRALVRAANQRGGEDNITVIAVSHERAADR